jgi:hypothetical protein
LGGESVAEVVAAGCELGDLAPEFLEPGSSGGGVHGPGVSYVNFDLSELFPAARAEPSPFVG